MDKAIQNCFDICPSSKRLGTGAVQSRAIYNIRTEEVLISSTFNPVRNKRLQFGINGVFSATAGSNWLRFKSPENLHKIENFC